MRKQDKKTIDSRAKGAKGELEVASFLTPWWGAIEPGCSFVRSPGSGGWGTAKTRGETKASGDLMPIGASLFPFCIEVKRHENWSDVNLLKGWRSPVWGWWRQCQRAALEVGEVPMLWFRRNRELWQVMIPSSFWSRYSAIAPVEVAPYRWNPRALRARVDYGANLPVLMSAMGFLRCLPSKIATCATHKG